MDKRAWTLYIALGFEFAGLIVAFIYIGSYLDEKYGWKGFGIAGGAVLGIVSWLIHFFALQRSLEKQKDSAHNQER